MRRVVRFVCFACIVAVFLFLAGAFSQGSAEPARSERPAAIESPPRTEAVASANSTSSNSSSGTIMITMTGVMDDEGYDK